MNPSLSHLGPEKRSRRKRTNRGWKSMWRPLSVSVLSVYFGFPAHSVPMRTANAIDRYIHLRADAQPDGTPEIDPRLSAIIETIFNRCIADGEYKQVRAFRIYWDFRESYPFGSGKAIGIALESRRLDIVKRIYEQTADVSVLSYAMEAVIDTQFSLSYRDLVLEFLYPLFPPPENRSPHIHALTRLVVALSSSATTVPLLVSLVPSKKLLAYQFAFDLVEGGSQDFLEAIKNELPEDDDEVRLVSVRLPMTVLTVVAGEQRNFHPDQDDTGGQDQCQLVLRVPQEEQQDRFTRP